MVCSSGKEVGLNEVFSWDVSDVQIELGKEKMPSSLSRGQSTGFAPVREVLVVAPDGDSVRRSEEIMIPRCEGSDDRQKLSVVNLVVPFSGVKALGEITTRFEESVVVSLSKYCASGGFGGVGFEDEGFMGVRHEEDGLEKEFVFESSECMLASSCPNIRSVLAFEIVQRFRELGVMGNESAIEVGETSE